MINLFQRKLHYHVVSVIDIDGTPHQAYEGQSHEEARLAWLKWKTAWIEINSPVAAVYWYRDGEVHQSA